MFYRWGVDLLKLPTSSAGNRYVMVAIEHYSKHIELIPLPSKEAAVTASAFAHAVLGRFGSCAEVVTDQGTEFQGEFEQLLQTAMIDHRTTSAARPQADGLAERCVQTVKRALRKLCEARRSKADWDKMLPWVALGYRCSPQQSTGVSPYQMLYACTPTIPPAIVERMQQPLDVDSAAAREAAAADLVSRSMLVQRLSIMAGDNLRIAQHRDTLRYARVRDGTYLPKLLRLEPGDFVYVKRQVNNTLDIKVRPLILRVVEVRPSGVVKLQGRCGRTVTVHNSQCAPCHLPDIDTAMDTTLAGTADSTVCEVCSFPDDEHLLLLCDQCNCAWHAYCLDPPLEAVPEGVCGSVAGAAQQAIHQLQCSSVVLHSWRLRSSSSHHSSQQQTGKHRIYMAGW
jgi:hypothetical protein